VSDLAALLRATPLRHGRICLLVMDGKWSAAVSHFNGRMTHPMGDTHGDPVDALEWALQADAAAKPVAVADEFADLL
jgi:hypothetical protein